MTVFSNLLKAETMAIRTKFLKTAWEFPVRVYILNDKDCYAYIPEKSEFTTDVSSYIQKEIKYCKIISV